MSQDRIERRVVVQITPTIDSVGTTQAFYFGERGFATAPTDTPANTVVRELLRSAGQWQQDLFGGSRMGGAVVPGGGRIVLINEGGALDAWCDYGVSGAPVIVWWGPPGAAFPGGYSEILRAYGRSVIVSYSTVEIELRDLLQLLDKPLVAATFAGTGGLEGTGVVGSRKQWVAGDPGFIPPILIDADRQIYWVQEGSTGGMQDLRIASPSSTSVMAFDTFAGGVRLTRAANYANSTELLATAPSAGECRLWFGDALTNSPGSRAGPVYLRLGSVPDWEVRVFAAGYAPDGNTWSLASLAQRAGLDITAHYDAGVAVHSRLVADDATYAEVMDDAALVDHAGYGFTRLDEFFTVRLAEPEAADTVTTYTTAAGSSSVTRALFTFTESNSRNWTRAPAAGLAEPVYQVSMRAGAVWPCEVDPAASATMRDYLTRQDAWASFTGINPDIQAAHPGAQVHARETPQRYFQNTQDMSRWVMRYLELFGGLRWVMSLEADMTDETLAIELADNAVVDIPRLTCSGGRAFRVVSKTIDIDRRVVQFGLWGGTEGPGGYLLTGEGGAPVVVNPSASRGRIAAWALRAYLTSGVSAWGFGTIGAWDLTSSSIENDPYFSSVGLLLRFEGGVTTDENTSRSNTITTNGTPTQSSTSPQFGTYSCDINNASADENIQITGSNFRASTTGSFTLEFWLYPISEGTSQSSGGAFLLHAVAAICTSSPVTGSNYADFGYFWWNAASGGTLGLANAGTPATGVSANTWHHIAYVVDMAAGAGNERQVYVDGVRFKQLSNVVANFNTLYFGNMGYGASLSSGLWANYLTQCRIDSVRFTDGVARYTGASFTVPATDFPPY